MRSSKLLACVAGIVHRAANYVKQTMIPELRDLVNRCVACSWAGSLLLAPLLLAPLRPCCFALCVLALRFAGCQ